MRKLVAVCLVVFLISGCAAPRTIETKSIGEDLQAEKRYQQELALENLYGRNLRVANLGYPILKAGTDFCQKKKGQFGFLAVYSDDLPVNVREAAVTKFNLVENQTIVSDVIEGSPAEIAGLQSGDRIISIENTTIDGEFNRFKDLIKVLDRIAKDGAIAEFTVIEPNSNLETSKYLTPETICDVKIEVREDSAINAYTDGKGIYLNSGILRFFRDDDRAIQTVIAHELAHITEGHVAKKMSNALMGGILGSLVFGVDLSDVGAMVYSQEFEREADYVSLYIMARAGMDTEGVENIWRDMAVANSESTLRNQSNIGSTHPSNPERYLNLRTIHQEIDDKKKAGLPLIPNYKN
ncbi:MAG: M48 family metallopeptidase [Proteobacteria bacterium]|nr:M48 family metallopeptidase [Pseudomonadota bacterium]